MSIKIHQMWRKENIAKLQVNIVISVEIYFHILRSFLQKRDYFTTLMKSTVVVSRNVFFIASLAVSYCFQNWKKAMYFHRNTHHTFLEKAEGITRYSWSYNLMEIEEQITCKVLSTWSRNVTSSRSFKVFWFTWQRIDFLQNSTCISTYYISWWDQ